MKKIEKESRRKKKAREEKMGENNIIRVTMRPNLSAITSEVIYNPSFPY